MDDGKDRRLLSRILHIKDSNRLTFDQLRENSSVVGTDRDSIPSVRRSRNIKQSPDFDSRFQLVPSQSSDADSATTSKDEQFLLFQSANPFQRRLIPVHKATGKHGKTADGERVYFTLPPSSNQNRRKHPKLQMFAIEYQTEAEFDKIFESTYFHPGSGSLDNVLTFFINYMKRLKSLTIDLFEHILMRQSQSTEGKKETQTSILER